MCFNYKKRVQDQELHPSYLGSSLDLLTWRGKAVALSEDTQVVNRSLKREILQQDNFLDTVRVGMGGEKHK